MKHNENFIDYKTSIILNAIEDGWIVYKKGDYYVFRKRHENKKEIFSEDYLRKFIYTKIKGEPLA